MFYKIYFKNGEKYCSAVSSREEFMSIRRSAAELVKACREGDESAKMRLPQINYTGHYTDGQLLKGNKKMSSWFVVDIDHQEEAKRVAALLKGREEELHIGMVEWSVNRGLHIVAKRRQGETIQAAQKRLAEALGGVEYDTVVHDITRVVFTTGEDDLVYCSPDLFLPDDLSEEVSAIAEHTHTQSSSAQSVQFPTEYDGLSYADIISKWWELHYGGKTPTEGNRNTRTYELACHLKQLCDYNADWLDQVIPAYDGFDEDEKMQCINDALNGERTLITKKMQAVLEALKLKAEPVANATDIDKEEEKKAEAWRKLQKHLPAGVRDSLQGCEPDARMAALLAIAPAIGALATGVQLYVHDTPNTLNLISFLVGDAASGKGQLNEVVKTWMYDILRDCDEIWNEEEEWRKRQQSQKNSKDADPDPRPTKPARMIPLNITTAALVERLQNTGGKHAYSFSCEADVVASAWKNATVSDFSTILRVSYDAESYHKETKSLEGATAHIPAVRWNVTLAGTSCALYRVISNYTDGLQTRICISQMPENTFAPLPLHPAKMTDDNKNMIVAVSRILRHMEGTVKLDELEKAAHVWLERIRLESLKNNDTTKAQQRMRVCVSAMRIVCCVMLCAVAEQLLKQMLKQNNNSLREAHVAVIQQLEKDKTLTVELLKKTQGEKKYTKLFNLVADELLENNLYFFRGRIEQATSQISSSLTPKPGKNDTVYAHLPETFTVDQARQAAIVVKGSQTTQNAVQQMLKNWKKRGLIATGKTLTEYTKCT